MEEKEEAHEQESKHRGVGRLKLPFNEPYSTVSMLQPLAAALAVKTMSKAYRSAVTAVPSPALKSGVQQQGR